MNIRRNAYNLCKSVWSSPIRDAVRTIIRNLNASIFGDASREYRAQLLGYLMVARDKERLAKEFPPFRNIDLSNEERQILLKAHKQIEVINKKCISRLIELVPECSSAIDPYFKFKYEIPYHNTEDVCLYDEHLAQILIQSFQTHPAVLSVLESNNRFKAVVPEAQRPSSVEISRKIFNLEEILINAGPLHAPKQLRELLTTAQLVTTNRDLLNYICALTCLKASLITLNELLYQAILTDKLPVLDKDNIIKIEKVVETTISTGCSLKYQENEKSGSINHELILVKTKIFDHEFNLCRVEKMRLNLSQELGDTVDVVIRIIDENLNPYSHLLSHWEHFVHN